MARQEQDPKARGSLIWPCYGVCVFIHPLTCACLQNLGNLKALVRLDVQVSVWFGAGVRPSRNAYGLTCTLLVHQSNRLESMAEGLEELTNLEELYLSENAIPKICGISTLVRCACSRMHQLMHPPT